MILVLPACLAAPPDPMSGPAKGDAGGGDATGAACARGATLDLVYVDQIAIPLSGASNLSLDGMAVFVNPGEDTVLLSGMSASAVGGDPRIASSVSISQGPAILTISPGEAKGAASAAAMTLLRAAFDETWADTDRPTLTVGFSLADGQAFEGTGAIDVPLEVLAGDYRFPVTVTLIGDGSKELGAPLSAARVTARCE